MLRFEGCIPAHHPALPGHFPGRPIVPGVVLLTEVERAVKRNCGAAIVEWPQVKFLSPLAPAQRYSVELEFADGSRARFCVVSGETPVATGTIRVGSGNGRE
jgi:3-hydroxymyristoyl/3-hydroxydecanoyl-(acyl carrier protein) dehydratase